MFHGRNLEQARRVAMEAHEKYGAETVGIGADCSEKGAMEKLVKEVFLGIQFVLMSDCLHVWAN